MLPRHHLILQRPGHLDERVECGTDWSAATVAYERHARDLPEGGRVLLCTTAGPDPEDRDRDRRRVCPSCHGTGTRVSRYGGPDGCFPDEDDCMRCWGAGYIAEDAVHPLRPDLATTTAGAR